MKYSATILAVAASAVAQFTEPAAISISNGLAAISDATSSLGDAIDAYTGPADSDALIASSGAVVAAIQSATSDLEPQPQMTDLNEAILLLPPTDDLNTVVGAAVDSAIAKKQAFVDACQGPTVLDQLNQQKTAATAYTTLIAEKVPEGADGIANDASAPILANLDRGITAFADQTSLPESCSASSAPTSAPTSVPTVSNGPAPTSVSSGVVTLPTGSATPVPTSGKPTATLSPGNPETCVPTTTTVTVTVPWTPPTHVPTGGNPPVPTGGHSTFIPGKPTPTPVTPPHFTGAAVANGVTFGGFAAAGLAMLAVF